jgi:hypothetical protein
VAYDSKTVQKLRLTANVLLQSQRKGIGRTHGEGASAVTPQAAACQVLIQVHAMHFNLESPSVLSVEWKRSCNRPLGNRKHQSNVENKSLVRYLQLKLRASIFWPLPNHPPIQATPHLLFGYCQLKHHLSPARNHVHRSCKNCSLLDSLLHTHPSSQPFIPRISSHHGQGRRLYSGHRVDGGLSRQQGLHLQGPQGQGSHHWCPCRLQ